MLGTFIIVVMGVCGCGKSTVGQALADALGVQFVDGDTYHPAANVQKMHSGVPLTDEDRIPWLQAIADDIRLWVAAGRSTVVACSALKRAYRDTLRSAGGAVYFLHLNGTRDVLAQRVGQRTAHFMPLALLDSQLATLQPVDGEVKCLTVDVSQPVEEVVALALAWLSNGSCAAHSPPDPA
eukprot:EG_transcript_26480